MKKIIVSIMTLSLLLAFNVSGSTETKGFKKFQLMPKDDAAADKEFSLFIQKFKKDVKDKKFESLKKSIAPDVLYEIESVDGLKGFIKTWKLDKNPKKSDFWFEMDRILSMGSAYYNDEKTAHAYPYLFVTFPTDYDSYEYMAVTGKKVNVRKTPDAKAPVVETIDYEIVKPMHVEPEPKNDIIGGIKGTWIMVKTGSGKEGYIFNQFLHSPLGYRAIFEKRDGRWMLTIFLAGD